MRSFHHEEKGFTLIEVLIVVVIVGILAAVVALNVGGFIGTGIKEVAIIEKDTMQIAVLGAIGDNGATSMDAIADYGLNEDDSEIILQYGGGDHPTELKGKYLIEAIQGAYSVTSNGMILEAKFPAGTPQYHWNPTDGWQPGPPE